MKNPIIQLGPVYRDLRGTIQMILENTSINSTSIISSEQNTFRASHWHKKDSHYCLVLAGEIWYYERELGSLETPVKTVISAGELFYTAPEIEHEMFFPTGCTFLCLSTLPRTHESYLTDTKRLPKKLKDIYEGIL